MEPRLTGKGSQRAGWLVGGRWLRNQSAPQSIGSNDAARSWKGRSLFFVLRPPPPPSGRRECRVSLSSLRTLPLSQRLLRRCPVRRGGEGGGALFLCVRRRPTLERGRLALALAGGSSAVRRAFSPRRSGRCPGRLSGALTFGRRARRLSVGERGESAAAPRRSIMPPAVFRAGRQVPTSALAYSTPLVGVPPRRPCL